MPISKGSRTIIKICVGVAIAGAFAAIFFSPLRHHLTIAAARDFVARTRGDVQGTWWAPLAFIVAYGVGCIFVIPATVFIVFAGAVWGWKLGVIYAMCGGMLGATASYFVGRFVGEGILERFGKAGEAVSRQVRCAGFTSMLVVRFIPGPPFAVWNYGAGVAGVGFGDYFFATLLGTFPAHLVFVYSADALFNGTMTEGDAIKRLALVGVLLIGMVLMTSLIKRRFAPKPAVAPVADNAQ
jgi:uncharacterized membrane protein YdjX (TVP38/TMEM64 family)